MDIKPQHTDQSLNDDQELAKVLAGITSQAGAPAPAANAADDTSEEPAAEQSETPEEEAPMAPPAAPAPAQPDPALPSPSFGRTSGEGLDAIKKDALSELRPLVDKLNVSPEEKFDTYLLLIRSTDDTALIAPAHEAARSIADEARRAQALLEIIKEIDYLSNPQGQPAPQA